MKSFYVAINTIGNVSTIQIKTDRDSLVEKVEFKGEPRFPLRAVLLGGIKLYLRQLRRKLNKIDWFEKFAKL